jgi:multidrug efflux pump subunit AcrA (membrane-fusion protein)
MSRRSAVWVALGTAGVLVLAGLGRLTAGDEATGADTSGEETTTVTIERRDLVERESLDGTLGFADTRTLTATGRGTLTRLPAEGSTVKRGEPLYELDGKRVFLFYGARPLWRPLSDESSDGSDVRQLEQNLVALGYDPGGDVEVDGTFDWATRAAVERWEAERGATENGVVDMDELVFLPGPRRVGEHRTALGAPVQPGAEVMETSSLRRVVTVQLDVSQQSLAAVGDAVEVELPDRRTVTGRVADVGKVAQATETQEGQESEPYVELTVSLASAGGSLDQAPVDVQIAKETKPDVLTVPVSALLAVAGGGYALDVVGEDGSRKLVPVETGLFADGYVEVEGRGLRAGTKVVVPQ